MIQQVEASETEVVRDQMQREGIELISGTARFLAPDSPGDPHRVVVLRNTEQAEAKTRYGVVCGHPARRNIDISFPHGRHQIWALLVTRNRTGSRYRFGSVGLSNYREPVRGCFWFWFFLDSAVHTRKALDNSFVHSLSSNCFSLTTLLAPPRFINCLPFFFFLHIIQSDIGCNPTPYLEIYNVKRWREFFV